MANNDGILKDLFFAIGVATVAIGSAYIIGKVAKKKLNIENEMIVGGDCICSDEEDDDTDTESDNADGDDVLEGFDSNEEINEDEI